MGVGVVVEVACAAALALRVGLLRRVVKEAQAHLCREEVRQHAVDVGHLHGKGHCFS